jgi:hypothetical protein
MTYMTYEWRKLTEQEIEEELQKLIRYKNGTTIATRKFQRFKESLRG